MKFSSDEYFQKLQQELKNEFSDGSVYMQLEEVIEVEVHNQINRSIPHEYREEVLLDVVLVVFKKLPQFMIDSQDTIEAQRAAWLHEITARIIKNHKKQIFKDTKEIPVDPVNTTNNPLYKTWDVKSNPEYIYTMQELDDEYHHLLKNVFNIRTSPEKLLAFMYTRIILNNDSSKINGKPSLAASHLNGKSLYQIFDDMKQELQISLQKQIPLDVYEGLKNKLDQTDKEGFFVGEHIFNIDVVKITDGNSRIQKKMRQNREDWKKGENHHGTKTH